MVAYCFGAVLAIVLHGMVTADYCFNTIWEGDRATYRFLPINGTIQIERKVDRISNDPSSNKTALRTNWDDVHKTWSEWRIYDTGHATLYTISGRTCTKTPFPKLPIINCVKMGTWSQLTIGKAWVGLSLAIGMEETGFQEDNVTWFKAWYNAGLPLFEENYSLAEEHLVVETGFYGDLYKNISDPSIFDVPDFCP